MLRALLEQDGFDVIGEADNGRDGLELVRTQRPDAVLLDLAMPGLDGLDSIPKIKESRPGVKVVVVSAAGRSLAADAFEAGADGYFSKSEPFDHILIALRRLFVSHDSG